MYRVSRVFDIINRCKPKENIKEEEPMTYRKWSESRKNN